MKYTLFHNLSRLPNDWAIDPKPLTRGNPILSNEKNEISLKDVLEYIKRCERFLIKVVHQMNNHTHHHNQPPSLSLSLSLSLIPFFVLCSSSIYTCSCEK